MKDETLLSKEELIKKLNYYRGKAFRNQNNYLILKDHLEEMIETPNAIGKWYRDKAKDALKLTTSEDGVDLS